MSLPVLVLIGLYVAGAFSVHAWGWEWPSFAAAGLLGSGWVGFVLLLVDER